MNKGSRSVKLFCILLIFVLLVGFKRDRHSKIAEIERKSYTYEFEKYKYNVDSIIGNSKAYITEREIYEKGLKVSEYLVGFQLSRLTLFKYHGRKLETELIYEYPETNKQWRDSTVFSYDRQGRLIRRVVHHFDNEEPPFIEALSYKGDTLFVGTDEDQVNRNLFYRCTNKNEVIRGFIGNSPYVKEISITKIDKYGNEFEMISCKSDTCERFESVSYVYDKYGNWTRMVLFDKNNKIYRIETQKISYN